MSPPSTASFGCTVCTAMPTVLKWLLGPLLLSALARNEIAEAANPCELRGCPKPIPGHINVHILSHSHMDAGWYLTLKELYNDRARNIYDSTTKALGENPSRRFVAAESVFFSLWYNQTHPQARKNVRDLVMTGRLQFVGGGWTQNDEATTHYTAIIDQMTLGLRFLNDTFGPQCGTPSVAWQADPFGHTAAQAALFARMGFSSMFLGRISFDKKKAWQNKKAMEFLWEADSREMGGDGGNILAWVPENRYESPSNITEGWTASVSTDGKIVYPWEVIRNYARDQTKVYTNDTVAIISGGDFNFADAVQRFRNQDEAILMANARNASDGNQPPINVFHSTPACYIEALHKSRHRWPRFSGELLPYTDEPGRTWTGLYTSRPNLKRMVRYANGFLQVCKQMSVLGRVREAAARVRKLGEAVATLQHHDGITGTCSRNAAGDYADMMHQGMKTCEPLISESLTFLLGPRGREERGADKLLGFCHRLNESHCPHTESVREFSVVVYNPASLQLFMNVRLPLAYASEPKFTVMAHGGTVIESQVVPLHRPLNESQVAPPWSLVFQAVVPPLGAAVYRVESSGAETAGHVTKPPDKYSSFIENERYRVHINPRTGLVSSIQLRGSGGVSVQLKQQIAVYDITQEDLSRMREPGAYVFAAEREPKPVARKVNYTVVKGPLVEEIHQEFNQYVSQVISLHKNNPHVQFTWTVTRSTERSEEPGSDTVSLFESDLDSSGFHTDSNGWRDVRRTITYEDGKLPIPSNFYPVVSWIYIEDAARDLMMVIFPDRPQGGTSRRKGHIELMVFRWHSTNDDLGNPESLSELNWNDNTATVARGTHRLFVGSKSEAKHSLRHQALGLVYQPLLAFAPAQWKPQRGTFTGLQYRLPKTVHLLTLERLSASQALLRLEHLAMTRKPARVNVTRLLVGYRLDNLRPLTLGANQFLPGPARHRWPDESTRDRPTRMKDVRVPTPDLNTVEATGDIVATLRPGEIATFMADLITE